MHSRIRIAALGGTVRSSGNAATWQRRQLQLPVETMDAAHLSVRCLGPLRVAVGGVPVEGMLSRRARDVFQLLVAAFGRPLHRESIMEVFWPEADPRRARNSLNQAVSGLRRALGAASGAIRISGELYSLDPHADRWVDAEEFARAVQEGRSAERNGRVEVADEHFETADVLYDGSLFEDDPLAEWALPLRQSLEDSYVEVLGRLATHRLDEGEEAAFVRLCREILAVQPYREDVHRDLILWFAGNGQRHLALHQFQLCGEALRGSLGMNPSPELQAIAAALRGGRPPDLTM